MSQGLFRRLTKRLTSFNKKGFVEKREEPLRCADPEIAPDDQFNLFLARWIQMRTIFLLTPNLSTLGPNLGLKEL